MYPNLEIQEEEAQELFTFLNVREICCRPFLKLSTSWQAPSAGSPVHIIIPTFLNNTTQTEQTILDFSSDSNKYYNDNISIDELESAINRTKNTSPGPDLIFYQMLKFLPDNAKAYLLKNFNKMFHDTVFPNQWKTATVVAFPKPGKDHSDPNNYRPISLTSCIAKTLERIVNRRLYEYLIIHKKIPLRSVVAEETDRRPII